MAWQDYAYPFSLEGEGLFALATGSLFWPARRMLVVSDLHFGKSERLARRGGTLLPPYETRDTLLRLESDLDATGAQQVVALGDSFDDLKAAEAMDEPSHIWLSRLMAGRDWTWIAGNHDAGPVEVGGTHRAEVTLGPLTLRHIADPNTAAAEVSGHYHPKARLAGRARPCFLLDARRLILPAYGTYTGGLFAHDPAFAPIMGAGAIAILTGAKAMAMPMPRG